MTEKVIEDLISGCIAGIVCRCIVAPLDVIKIRFQIQNHGSILETVEKILKKEGIKGFWKGNVPGILMTGPWTGIHLSVYSKIKSLCGYQYFELSPNVISFISGAAGSIVATTSIYPLDLMRTRLAIQTHGQWYSGLNKGLLRVFKEEGFNGIYRGLGPTLINIVPQMSIQMSIYEQIRNSLCKKNMEKNTVSFVSGTVASVVTKVITMPLDVIKKNMQIQGESCVNNDQKYKNGWHCAKSLVQQGGIKRLWYGVTPAILKSGPSGAITMGVFDLCSRNWENIKVN